MTIQKTWTMIPLMPLAYSNRPAISSMLQIWSAIPGSRGAKTKLMHYRSVSHSDFSFRLF